MKRVRQNRRGEIYSPWTSDEGSGRIIVERGEDRYFLATKEEDLFIGRIFGRDNYIFDLGFKYSQFYW